MTDEAGFIIESIIVKRSYSLPISGSSFVLELATHLYRCFIEWIYITLNGATERNTQNGIFVSKDKLDTVYCEGKLHIELSLRNIGRKLRDVSFLYLLNNALSILQVIKEETPSRK